MASRKAADFDRNSRIAPGKPIQNALIENFNGRLRDEFLSGTLLSSLVHARAMLANCRADYNVNMHHAGLGWQTPAELAQTFPRREPALRNPASSAPAHAAPAQPAQKGQIQPPERSLNWMKLVGKVTDDGRLYRAWLSPKNGAEPSFQMQLVEVHFPPNGDIGGVGIR